MLSVNQLAANIKLTVSWKMYNTEGYPINLGKNYENLIPNDRIVRSHINREWNEDGRSIAAKEGFSRSTAKLWSQAPNKINNAKSLPIAKRLIKDYCKALPI